MITLTGRGIFPRISFDLPRDNEDPRYCKYLESAKSSEGFKVEGKTSDVSQNDQELVRTSLIQFRIFRTGNLSVRTHRDDKSCLEIVKLVFLFVLFCLQEF